MIRTFVGIDLSEDLLGPLRGLTDRLRTLHLEGRIPRPESIHLTLRFLGEVDRDQIPSIQQALRESARQVALFDVPIGCLGTFPDLRRPRVLWVGVDECEGLWKLKHELEAELLKLGFPGDKRSFRPHLTLMRLRSGRNREQLAGFLSSENGAGRLGVLEVAAVHLYQSVLRPQGAEYRKLVSIKLAQPPKPG